MYLSQISFILLYSNLFLIFGNSQKCCKKGEHFVGGFSRYTCVKLVNERLQANFAVKDFLSKNGTGECLEILSGKNVVKFSLDRAAGRIEKQIDYGEHYFPKCCPLGFSYNKTTHGCEAKPGSDLDILRENSFVRVGLPQCRIISDKILESVQEVKMNREDLILLKEKRILDENYCVDSTLDGKLVVRTCEEDIQICSRIMCIHKCCHDGQSFINGSKCRDTFVHGVDLHFSDAIRSPDEPFVLIHGFRPKLHVAKKFFIDRFGTFVTYMASDTSDNFEASEDAYCMDHVFSNNKNYKKVTMNKFYVFGQKVEQKIELKILVTRWVKIISCIFLILTILVYLLLPKMRNLFGKILLSYCVSTFTFFFVLVISQFYSEDFGDALCTFIGFLSILACIWSFTWLHIMCIDIWFSFGTPRTLCGPLQKKEWKRLLQYSLYGWGFPILWIGMIAIFSVTTMMPEAMHPVIGQRKCYLEHSESRPGNYSYLIYITFPLIVQQIINTTLFTKTILYCLKIKAEIERMNDCEKRTAFNVSKERKPNTFNTRDTEYFNSFIFHRLGLIMKLAVIMGVFLLFETVSSIYNFKATDFTLYLEVVLDSINCLQGLYIFIIFICKKKVFDQICEKIPMLKSRKASIASTVTQISMHNISGSKMEKTPEERTSILNSSKRNIDQDQELFHNSGSIIR